MLSNYKANVRDIDNEVLGIVSDRYKIVQNKEAFDFTDLLIGNGVTYETAGSLRKGKTIWLLVKLPETKILGDNFAPYICFSNTHDGTSAVKVCMTPIRVVCSNTLNLALNSATRTWSARHTGNIALKLEEAKETLGLAHKYMTALDKEADQLANSSITEEKIHAFVEELFPIKDTDSDRQKTNIKTIRDNIMVCYFSPDLIKFAKTKWGVINAVSDWCGHAEPIRNSNDFKANNWGRIMNGHVVMDKAFQLLTTKY